MFVVSGESAKYQRLIFEILLSVHVYADKLKKYFSEVTTMVIGFLNEIYFKRRLTQDFFFFRA